MDPVRAANNGATPFSIACNVGAMEVVQTLAADVRVDITQGNRQVRLRVLVLCLAACALDAHTWGTTGSDALRNRSGERAVASCGVPCGGRHCERERNQHGG